MDDKLLRFLSKWLDNWRKEVRKHCGDNKYMRGVKTRMSTASDNQKKPKYTKQDLFNWIISRYLYKQRIYKELIEYAERKWGKGKE